MMRLDGGCDEYGDGLDTVQRSEQVLVIENN